MSRRLIRTALGAAAMAAVLLSVSPRVSTQVTVLNHDTGPVGLGLYREARNDGASSSVAGYAAAVRARDWSIQKIARAKAGYLATDTAGIAQVGGRVPRGISQDFAGTMPLRNRYRERVCEVGVAVLNRDERAFQLAACRCNIHECGGQLAACLFAFG